MMAGIAMLKIHNKELAENTIIPKDEFILFIISHFSKIKILTEPLTAISIIVINGTIIISKYVNEIGIIALKYVNGMLKAQIKSTNWNVYRKYLKNDKVKILNNSFLL